MFQAIKKWIRMEPTRKDDYFDVRFVLEHLLENSSLKDNLTFRSVNGRTIRTQLVYLGKDCYTLVLKFYSGIEPRIDTLKTDPHWGYFVTEDHVFLGTRTMRFVVVKERG